MAVVIRLSRHGRRNQPFYRIVVADEDYPRDGRFLEVVGTFDPQNKENKAEVKQDRLEHWIGKGAKPSDTVAQILRRGPVQAAS
jgi:small subunit ribosomal protein S16